MIKKQFKKRLLSMVLCGAMVLSLCPQTAIAKQTDHSAEASVSLDGGSGTDAPQKLRRLKLRQKHQMKKMSQGNPVPHMPRKNSPLPPVRTAQVPKQLL